MIDDHKTAYVERQISRNLESLQEILDDAFLKRQIISTANCIKDAFQNGLAVLICGNGGSAADAQHMAGEFVGRFMRERQACPAIALTTDTSVLTAIGNDYGFNKVFSRQVEAYADVASVLIAISTSGKSENVLKALRVANDNNMYTIGLSRRGSGLGGLCDFLIEVPSHLTPNIQEAHLMIEHIICGLVEEMMFGQEAEGSGGSGL
jgi:D-sedoheptulose 7-phosphate isomerase